MTCRTSACCRRPSTGSLRVSFTASTSITPAEEYPFGATATPTAALAVSFGSDNLVTPTLSYPNAGFTGWTLASMVFVANSTSETLSFMSLSTPNGYPPLVLLDGVTMSSVPEPSALLLVAVGLVGVGGFRKARRLCRSPTRPDRLRVRSFWCLECGRAISSPRPPFLRLRAIGTRRRSWLAEHASSLLISRTRTAGHADASGCEAVPISPPAVASAH